jgi:DtxR family Mn-dependent transcriptional regulator
VIRVHRLWERYLADETSVPPTEWHSHPPKKRSITLTEAETEALAAQIGNPHFDPHGDPIPTPAGEMPPKQGHSLLSLNNGEFAVITHIEDEPEAVFAQLIAQGLYVGMQVMMIERSNERVRFAADGEEIILAPILTNNVTVAPITDEEHRITTPMSPLSSLPIGMKKRKY